MDFLNPAALYGLLALPLLLVPYLIRRKPERAVFSSLLLFSELGARASGRPWGRLRLPPIFFLQLLLLTFLILALGEPVFSTRPNRLAIVIDTSASMQALENGTPRFQLAQQEARTIAAGLPATASIDIYRTAPRIEKVSGTGLDPDQALGTIAELRPYDLGEAPVDYDTVLNQLAAQHKYERVYLLTDRPARQGEIVRTVSIGGPNDNLALTSFRVNRSSLTDSRLNATVELTSYASKDAKARIALRGAGTLIASRELTVGAGKSASTSFEGVPERAFYEAEIETADPLPLDNRRFALAPQSRAMRILAISPRPQAVASLRSIPGVRLDVVAPERYGNIDRSGYALELFHLGSPEILPESSALYVLPPGSNTLVEPQAPVRRPLVSSWREPHPITRYVNFSLFRPSYARPLRPEAAGESVVEIPEGPLVFTTEYARRRQVVLGFDPFPYLGRENLPMSVFTLNLLDWFFENAAAGGTATGGAFSFEPARSGDLAVTPEGEKIPLKTGQTSFGETLYQGLYQVVRGGDREFYAANLQDATESDLRRRVPIDLRGAAGGSASPSMLFALWPYLLIAALMLLIAEWFVHARGQRGRGVFSRPTPRHA